MKKLLSTALCLCLVLALIPVGVLAEDPGGGDPGGGPGGDNPGAFAGKDSAGDGQYVIDEDITINTSGASVRLSSAP